MTVKFIEHTKPSNTAMARGSWGAVEFDTTTGNVVALHDEPASYIVENGVEERGYRDIVKVDVAEWRKTYPNETLGDVDVLDVGYWIRGGSYEPPVEDWRAEFRKQVGVILPNDTLVAGSDDLPSDELLGE